MLRKIFLSLFYFVFITIVNHSFVFAEKTFFITAATSGIGEAVCKNLASKGYNLILTARNMEKLEKLKTNLELNYTGQFKILTFDYANLQSIDALASKVNEPIDGIVVIPPRMSLPSQIIPTSEQWGEAFANCFIGPLQFIKVLTDKFNLNSSIVVISGITSVYFMPEYTNSNVLRIMWTAEVKNLSIQLSSKKIRVNEISPGVILTQHNIQKIKERAQKENRSFENQLELESSTTPSHRYGQPEDLAHSIAFLLSNESSHINGTNLIIDGGLNRAY